jgi:hypothetical protein
MTRQDIALTVGGILSTFVVAYLIYRMQRRDAAAEAEANASAATDQTAQDAANAQQMADASTQYEYASILSSVGTPSITGTTNSTASAVTSSGTTAVTGDGSAAYDSTDINKLLGQIIDEFSAPLMPDSTITQGMAATIPTVAGLAPTDLSTIPITAAAAAASAPTPYTVTVDGLAPYPSNMQTGWNVSSHPVEAHPIVTTGT